MKNTALSRRKCSAMLAAGAGVAVCLTGGGAQGAFVTGNIKGVSNTTSVFGVGGSPKAFGGSISWHLNVVSGRIVFNTGTISMSCPLNRTGGPGKYIAMHPAGVTVSNGMGTFDNVRQVPNSVSDKYIATRFVKGGTRYGWLHVVSSNGTGTSITIDKWGYENTGASVKTLSESVTTQKLGLSNGQVKLHWTNKNEDGVARYEVQAKDASGAWKAVDSSTPGEGHYAAMVAGGSECRLVVEKVDGATQQINF